MTHVQKRILILRELYNHKYDGSNYWISKICESQNITIANSEELRGIVSSLDRNGFICCTVWGINDHSTRISSRGIEEVENKFSLD